MGPFRLSSSIVIVSSLLFSAGCTGPERATKTDGGGPPLSTLSAVELAAMMERGETTSEQIVRACLREIEARDGELHAVIAVDPGAVEQARALDAERDEGRVRGPLHGIPVLLKDNIESAGPLPTTAGSLVLAKNVTDRDAPLVASLRQAGLVILGKTNLSQWANFRSERSSSGWSAVGGQTRNPHDPTRSPCGSSSGSAVAVAAGMVPLAVGTETDGSVVCPSSVNGVVGIKPTVGLISRRGIVPISHTQDTAGPMARTVEDAALLLEAMIAVDPEDPVTARAEQARDWNLLRDVPADSLDGRRIGVLRSATGYHDRVDRLFEQALETLRARGAVLVEGLGFETPEGFEAASYDVLLYEFHHDIDAYFAGLPDSELAELTLEKVVAFNREHAGDELRWFGQEIFIKAMAKGELSEPAYTRALEMVQRATRRDGIDRLIGEYHLDALVAPTTAPAWKIDLIDGDHFLGGVSSYPAIAGYPHLTVPMGDVEGLPVGLSFFGRAMSEPVLVAIARAFVRGATSGKEEE